jgi:hypothetical protein
MMRQAAIGSDGRPGWRARSRRVTRCAATHAANTRVMIIDGMSDACATPARLAERGPAHGGSREH